MYIADIQEWKRIKVISVEFLIISPLKFFNIFNILKFLVVKLLI